MMCALNILYIVGYMTFTPKRKTKREKIKNFCINLCERCYKKNHINKILYTKNVAFQKKSNNVSKTIWKQNKVIKYTYNNKLKST